MGFMYGYHLVYQQELHNKIKALEQHDLCYDTPKEEAWVAYKNGEARCFREQKEYPHRVKASYLDNGTH